MFVARINSQEREKTRIDRRRIQFVDMYSPGELSAATQGRLIESHRQAGLVSAAYDFTVTPEGKEVFLDCSPGGQWLWIQDSLKVPISEAMASALGSSS